MPTTNQLVRKGRKARKRRSRYRHLKGAPMRKAVVLKTGVVDPRKPNSGKRHVARVRFDDGSEVTASIPGEGHNVREHSIVLIKGGNRPDQPGVRYHVVRGTRDAAAVERRTARSRYGAKRK